MSDQNQHNEDFESLCAGYVLDALSPEEARRFEELLRRATPEQKQLYEEMQQVRDELAFAAEPASPSGRVEKELFTGLSSEPGDSGRNSSKSPSGRAIPLWIYQAAAALFLAGTLTLAWISLDLSGKVDQYQTTITELQSELERQEQLLDVLAAREVTLVMMAGLDPSPEGYGKIIWDPENRRAVLQVANLPAPPEDKDYQLWLIKEGQDPVSAGVFNFDQPATDLFFKVEYLEEDPSPVSNTFAVTLEPAGGVPRPTGDMFLLGEQE